MTDTPRASPPSDADPGAAQSSDADPGAAQLPPPAEAATPVPPAPPGDEGARQAAETIRSISRLEEAN